MSSVEGVSGAQQPQPAEWKSPAEQLDQEAFLKLLVAQLRYQDPLNPSDSQEFMAQTAQFATVEKLTALVEAREQDASMMRLSMAGQFVGKVVAYPKEDGTMGIGEVTAARVEGDSVLLRVGEDVVDLSHVVEVAASSPADGKQEASSGTEADQPAGEAGTNTNLGETL